MLLAAEIQSAKVKLTWTSDFESDRFWRISEMNRIDRGFEFRKDQTLEVSLK